MSECECGEIGLEVNKLKSEIMVVGEKEKEKEEHIEGIEIKEVIRYLGVWIDNKGTLKKTVMDRVQKSQRMRRYVNYLIAGRQRKLELGRIMWKGAVIPGIVFGLFATGGEKRSWIKIREGLVGYFGGAKECTERMCGQGDGLE